MERVPAHLSYEAIGRALAAAAGRDRRARPARLDDVGGPSRALGARDARRRRPVAGDAGRRPARCWRASSASTTSRCSRPGRSQPGRGKGRADRGEARGRVTRRRGRVLPRRRPAVAPPSDPAGFPELPVQEGVDADHEADGPRIAEVPARAPACARSSSRRRRRSASGTVISAPQAASCLVTSPSERLISVEVHLDRGLQHFAHAVDRRTIRRARWS